MRRRCGRGDGRAEHGAQFKDQIGDQSLQYQLLNTVHAERGHRATLRVALQCHMWGMGHGLWRGGGRGVGKSNLKAVFRGIVTVIYRLSRGYS